MNKIRSGAAAAFFAAAVMLVPQICAAEDSYIVLPFSGDQVQTVDVYTGEPVVLKCEEESTGQYTWWSSFTSSGGAGVIGRRATDENTYTYTNSAQSYHNGYRLSVSVETEEGTLYSKSIKLNVIYRTGDVDGDGTVDKNDAALLLKYLCGTEKFEQVQLDAADANNDGKISISDPIAILKSK